MCCCNNKQTNKKMETYYSIHILMLLSILYASEGNSLLKSFQSSDLLSLQNEQHIGRRNNRNSKQNPTLNDFLNEAFQWGNQCPTEKKYQYHSESPMSGFFTKRTVAASILTCAAAALSSSAGIGGGGLYVSILSLVMEYDSRTSAAISAFMVLTGSVVGLFYYVPNRHPTVENKALIDYDLALILQPNMLLGISLGVVCNLMFPEWLVLLILALFLSYITFSSCKSSFRIWNAESAAYRVCHEEESSCSNGLDDGKCGDSIREPLLVCKKEKNSMIIPVKKLSILVLVWVFFYIINLLLKDKGCGIAYWMISGSQIPLAVLITAWVICSKKTSTESNDQEEVEQMKGAHFVFPITALFAGVLGGMLGAGGGMLINPFLIKFGFPAQVTAATSAFMVFFSSSMSVAEFIIFGEVPIQHALYFSMLCLASSLVGLVIVNYAIAKYGRASLIIFSVSTSMMITTVLVIAFGSLKVRRQFQDGEYMGFKTPC